MVNFIPVKELKMRILVLSVVLLSFSTVFGRPQAYFNYKVYYTPEQQSYISMMLQFSSGTLSYKGSENGDLFAQIEITQVFRLGDSIVVADKYLLDSPPMKDSTVEDFYDIQRYSIKPGIYDYELIIKDVISGEVVSGEQSIKIEAFHQNELLLSDIEFISDAYQTEEKNNFTRNGFFILPYLTDYYPPEMNKIAFYFEVYNADKVLGENEKYLVTYSVTDFENSEGLEEVFRFQKITAQKITPVIGYLPLDKVPTGEFNLNINVINQDGDTILSKPAYFMRRNDLMGVEHINIADVQIDRSFETEIPRDSIPYFLASLMPISPMFEYETIRGLLKENDTTKMAKYFYAYWLETNPKHPYFAWSKYKSQVYYCEQMFGTQIKAGFETDRGRTYLKYGPPNSMIDRPNEPSAYPYQIWHYYRIGQRSNIMFVFYNPDLVTNDYPMLHSELPGEIQNYRWEHDLHRRNSPSTNVDNGNDGNTIHYGGNSGVYFRNP